MPAPKTTFQFKVIHRHRIGDLTFTRVSELVFIAGAPKAVLAWMDVGGIRVPIYCDLSAPKLRDLQLSARSSPLKRTYYYGEVTVDPRYDRQAGIAPAPAFQPPSG